MPSTYAHYRLGQTVREHLSGPAKKAVETFPQLYLIGLHGPDIFFYYKPIFSTETNRIGYDTHDKSGREFFENAARVIKSHPDDKRYLSYICGFICHFALDVTCHGYIDRKIADSGVCHTEIEVEFDRMLMTEDGLDPVRHKLAEHIVPSSANAQAIQAFFPMTDIDHVKKALKDMIFYNDLIVAPGKPKRTFIKGLLKASGNYDEMHGVVVNLKPNPKCRDSNETLRLLYGQAEKLAERLVAEYMDYLEGKGELDPVYDRNFGSYEV